MRSNNQETPVKLPEKLWGVDDPYRYALPKPNAAQGEDIWKNCLVPLQREDEKQCGAWREEVQNLLIFAGLFSAVVTTFVVDSYKNLQPSSDQRTVVLLSQIVSSLNNSSDSGPSPLSPFSPSPSSVRVNALWFTSLVISLMTAVVGIVALQWIREYERYSGHWMPKEVFELRNVRHESMISWFVPQILAGLPLLLQVALILFFIGLVDFLLNLYPRAGIPTVVVVSGALLFLTLTTILPTLQYYTTFQSQHFKIPATPFPYKSPQSLIVLQLARSIAEFLCVCGRRTVYIIATLRGKQPNTKRQVVGNLSNWNAFDWAWVEKRSLQANKNRAKDRLVEQKDQNQTEYYYDTALGVAHVVSNYCQSSESVALSAYHCFLEQHETKFSLSNWSPESLCHFYKCLKPCTGPVHSGMGKMSGSKSDTQQDDILMTFLEMFQLHSASIPSFSPQVHRQQMELLVRMNTTLQYPYLQWGDGKDIITRVSTSVCYNWNLSEGILDDALALQLISLYNHLVTEAVQGVSSSQWDLTGPGILEVTAVMDFYSIPSFVRLRHLVEPIHEILAKRILQPQTQPDFFHRLGYRFIATTFFRHGPGLLPKWSESYKKAFSSLVTAVFRTMKEYPDVHHDENVAKKMKDFLRLREGDEPAEFEVSPDSNIYLPSEQYSTQHISPLPGAKPSLKTPPMEEPVPELNYASTSTSTPRTVLPPLLKQGDVFVDIHPPHEPTNQGAPQERTVGEQHIYG